MSVEVDIKEALSSLVGGVYFDTVDFGMPRPYVVVQDVGGEPVNFLELSAATTRNGRFQVNVWADTREQASAIGRAVETILVESELLRATVLTGLISLSDPATKLRGTRQDFSIWFSM